MCASKMFYNIVHNFINIIYKYNAMHAYAQKCVICLICSNSFQAIYLDTMLCNKTKVSIDNSDLTKHSPISLYANRCSLHVNTVHRTYVWAHVEHRRWVEQIVIGALQKWSWNKRTIEPAWEQERRKWRKNFTALSST